jgi:hypothetical protein
MVALRTARARAGIHAPHTGARFGSTVKGPDILIETQAHAHSTSHPRARISRSRIRLEICRCRLHMCVWRSRVACFGFGTLPHPPVRTANTTEYGWTPTTLARSGCPPPCRADGANHIHICADRQRLVRRGPRERLDLLELRPRNPTHRIGGTARRDEILLCAAQHAGKLDVQEVAIFGLVFRLFDPHDRADRGGCHHWRSAAARRAA